MHFACISKIKENITLKTDEIVKLFIRKEYSESKEDFNWNIFFNIQDVQIGRIPMQ